MLKANDDTRERLAALVEKREPIVVAGVGSGLTAQGAVLGGADLLAVYNTAVYRVRGLSTALAFLPYDDANTITLNVVPDVVAAAVRAYKNLQKETGLRH